MRCIRRDRTPLTKRSRFESDGSPGPVDHAQPDACPGGSVVQAEDEGSLEGEAFGEHAEEAQGGLPGGRDAGVLGAAGLVGHRVAPLSRQVGEADAGGVDAVGGGGTGQGIARLALDPAAD